MWLFYPKATFATLRDVQRAPSEPASVISVVKKSRVKISLYKTP